MPSSTSCSRGGPCPSSWRSLSQAASTGLAESAPSKAIVSMSNGRKRRKLE